MGSARNRAAGGVLAAFLALAAVGACSSGGQQASDPTTLAQYTPETQAGDQAAGGLTAEVSAGTDASAAPTGSDTSVTTEELSKPDVNYTVLSLPPNLTPEQIAVVRDFAYYDQVTWGTVQTVDGLDKVRTVLTGEALESYTSTYNSLETAGHHYEGTYIIDITYVEVTAETGTAVVGVCADKTQTRRVSADGEDVSTPNEKGRFAESMDMVREGDRWIVTTHSDEGNGSC
ncbi:hypothetical protein NSA19_13520 [Actinomyces bowdenii]|uniref:hypothetical protein n=1 Tax=Actinomyces bowdenii TaxID=131109 RepID=UPI00214C56BA|nr:hypothetical protein [Actinomyces bowdenii]MCR2053837.1 hypothetical protein [Actinomyces bowdenii]